MISNSNLWLNGYMIKPLPSRLESSDSTCIRGQRVARTPRTQRISRYPFEVVCQHIRKEHPGCPDFAIHYIAKQISERQWNGVNLGRAVGITMQSILRHQMTEYETLLLHGVERETARQQVQPKIQAMLEVWKRQPPKEPPEVV